MDHEIKNKAQGGGRARFRAIASWKRLEMDDSLWPFPRFAYCGLWLYKGSDFSWATLIPSLEGPSSKKLSRDRKSPLNLSAQQRSLHKPNFPFP